MSITLLLLIILAAMLLLVSLVNSDTSPRIKPKITLKELQHIHCSHPPILVTTIKNGCMQETLCYFATDEQDNEPQVMEIVPDNDFVVKYRWKEKRLSH